MNSQLQDCKTAYPLHPEEESALLSLLNTWGLDWTLENYCFLPSGSGAVPFQHEYDFPDPFFYHISGISFSNQNFGTIPPSIASFSHLSALHLDNVQLTGGIPEFLSNFTNIFLSQLGSLPLVALVLPNNRLVGPIPEFLGQISSLEAIELSNNSFSGPIPASLASLPNIRFLFLSHNLLTDDIPYFSSSKLEFVNLGYNRFTKCPEYNISDTMLHTCNFAGNSFTTCSCTCKNVYFYDPSSDSKCQCLQNYQNSNIVHADVDFQRTIVVHKSFAPSLDNINELAKAHNVTLKIVSSLRSPLSLESNETRNSRHILGCAVDFNVLEKSGYCNRDCIEALYDTVSPPSSFHNTWNFIQALNLSSDVRYAPPWNGVPDYNHFDLLASKLPNVSEVNFPQQVRDLCAGRCSLSYVPQGTPKSSMCYGLFQSKLRVSQSRTKHRSIDWKAWINTLQNALNDENIEFEDYESSQSEAIVTIQMATDSTVELQRLIQSNDDSIASLSIIGFGTDIESEEVSLSSSKFSNPRMMIIFGGAAAALLILIVITVIVIIVLRKRARYREKKEVDLPEIHSRT